VGSEKKTPVLRILNLIDRFCDAHLSDEYNSYAIGLMDRITNMPDLNLSRGRSEIWAAAIVTVIARLNFLFDKADLDAITMQDISTFFGAIKSTVGNKATVIEKACNIGMGEAGLCREEITEALTFSETSEGFIVPLSMLSGRGEIVEHVGERKKTLENGQAKNENWLPKKNKTDSHGDDRQLSLFDDF